MGDRSTRNIQEFPADKAKRRLECAVRLRPAPYHERKVTLPNGPSHCPFARCFLPESTSYGMLPEWGDRKIYPQKWCSKNWWKRDLPKSELEFANDVLDNNNPLFVDHQVTSIMLNSFPSNTRHVTRRKFEEYLNAKAFCREATCIGTGSDPGSL